MTYTHLSTDELVIIESYFHQNVSVSKISKLIGRARQTVHNVVAFLKSGHTVLDYYSRYKANKKRCGRRPTVLSAAQQAYVEEKVTQGWSPDVLVGRQEHPISCSACPLYRPFDRQIFNISALAMKGKRKTNGYKERRDRPTFKRNISEIMNNYLAFNTEFGHL